MYKCIGVEHCVKESTRFEIFKQTHYYIVEYIFIMVMFDTIILAIFTRYLQLVAARLLRSASHCCWYRTTIADTINKAERNLSHIIRAEFICYVYCLFCITSSKQINVNIAKCMTDILYTFLTPFCIV